MTTVELILYIENKVFQIGTRSSLFTAISVLMAIVILNAIVPNNGQTFSNQDDRNEHEDKQIKFSQLEKSLKLKNSNIASFNTISKSNSEVGQSQVSNNESDMATFELSSFLRSPQASCVSIFKCNADFTTGWKDKTSIQLSTNNTNKTSRVIGQELKVQPKERYELVIHIKQNEWSRQSYVHLEGFNETANHWYYINQCPSAGLNGRIEWQEFSCGYTIEANTSKVRPVLEAGWSNQSSRRAITWFDLLYLTKFTPFLRDPNLKVEIVTQGLDAPVSIAFLGSDDFLVIENKGTVLRIVNGAKLSKPLLNLDVDDKVGDGLLGVAISENKDVQAPETGIINANITDKSTYIFLYFSTHREHQGLHASEDTQTSNRLYRYELVNNTLINPKLILELPGGANHDGGPILIGPDKQSVYLSVGDVENEEFQVLANKALNNKTGGEPDGTGGILRFTPDGEPVHEGLFGKEHPLNLYYAYGIRESFGMDFDPLTGRLWDTENGANWGDEINLVVEGFNGGWNKVQGIWRDHIRDNLFNTSDVLHKPSDLVDFGGKGKYSEPKFVWKYTVGPTALKFMTTDKLGKEYQNDMFVGDVNNGRIYHFKLDQNRTGLLLQGPLGDKVADTDRELDNVTFAGDFGIITDLKIGPDGYLYFVVYDEGKIYRIIPGSNT